MKNVKIFLGALAVLTFVGGALAFKAQKFGQHRLYTKSGPNCISYTTSFLTTQPNGTSVGQFYTTNQGAEACDILVDGYIDAE